MIIPQKDIVTIRAKKVRFLINSNTSSLLENRLRLGLGSFDPSRRLPRAGPLGAVVFFLPHDAQRPPFLPILDRKAPKWSRSPPLP